jgi:hypothetical protein
MLEKRKTTKRREIKRWKRIKLRLKTIPFLKMSELNLT